MAQIKVKITQKGDTTLEVNGVEGSTCEDVTAKLIQSLGEAEETVFTEAHEQELPDYINNQSGD